MTAQEIKTLLEEKIPIFLEQGGVLSDVVFRVKNKCCPLGVLHYFSSDPKPNNWLEWFKEKLDLKEEEIISFICGFDGEELLPKKFGFDRDFYQLGKELRTKYLLKTNQERV